MKELPIIQKVRSYGARVALRSGDYETRYEDLLTRSAEVASTLLGGASDLNEMRVAFLAPAGEAYVAVQWGIWRAGGVVVPLCLSATVPELEYTLKDSQAAVVFATTAYAEKVKALTDKLGRRLVIFEAIDQVEPVPLPEVQTSRRGMILYTSGTTSSPKGVVTTHDNISAQILTLVEAWKWRADDCIPLFLPLHHIHGIINVMSCALWSGALIEPFARFDVERLLARVSADAYTVFMAVPTIYVKLIQAIGQMAESKRKSVIAGFGRMRLMISGSAALPASVHEEWTALTGQKLLERYGMTEIGMAISNPYDGERRPGAVGQPLPGMQVRLKAENGAVVDEEGVPGEIQVRGPCVFSEYWNLPETSKGSFDEGWFRTGDMAVIETGYYRIMGRLSVDIIKSGGYKLSALEIEAVLLDHPEIRECAVVGAADETWGEAVAAAVVMEKCRGLTIESLRDWCRDYLSVYKIPQRLKVVDKLPRNAMGKVTKPAVATLFEQIH